MNKTPRIIGAFIVAVLINFKPVLAGPFEHLLNPDKPAPKITLDRESLLESSQVSYRAEDGFTGVHSYGVIISCVKGKISVMKSIYDPRLPDSQSRIRQLGSMDEQSYLALWDNLKNNAIFRMQDAPQPAEDISDEFTVSFFAKVGGSLHQFRVYGISRPDASRYFAIQKLIDDSVQMASLWNAHTNLAARLESPEISQKNPDTSPF